MAFLYSLQIVFTPLAIRTTEWNDEVPYRHLFVSMADNNRKDYYRDLKRGYRINLWRI